MEDVLVMAWQESGPSTAQQLGWPDVDAAVRACGEVIA